ncbi:hypothetical protein AVEN_106969-1 [Araneus ventricosus]|uniref:Uncharacterized protein n=1 Tax=Araneus ventricosus TaxID=182803 RepID=A0A4Y2QA95_ARAVE|nr:hypothetical protein AVEN_106969-1 [Araneus ventricosus]
MTDADRTQDNQKTGSHSGPLNDSLCNISSTEAGVLVAITDHDPTHPVGGTYYHWKEDPRPSPILYSPGKREPTYLPGGFSSVYTRCPR